MQIRANILTESNIRDLVRLMDEEMDGVAAEQRERLENIEAELIEVRRRLDRVWHVIENSELDISDATSRIREHRERQEKLEIAAEEARALLSERQAVLDNVDTIAAFAEDMSDFLMTSEITESRAFIKSFVKEIKVKPGKATVYYTIPTPPDSPIGGSLRPSSQYSTRWWAGLDEIENRGRFPLHTVLWHGNGVRQRRLVSHHLDALHEVADEGLALRERPILQEVPEVRPYPLISSVVGSSTLRCSSWVSASSLAASSCSSRCLSEKIRGDRTSNVNSLVSRAS